MPTRRKIRKRKIKKNNKASFLLFFTVLITIFFLSIISVREYYHLYNGKNLPPIKEVDKVAPEPVPENPIASPKPIEEIEGKDDFGAWMDSLVSLNSFFIPHMGDFSSDQIVDHGYYILSYNEAHEQAHWVVYKLRGAQLYGPAKRGNNFMIDPQIITGSADPEDYKYSMFDRGHLAPAGDFIFDQEAMDKSFFMSNISPQDPGFNRGIWKKLENQVRSWAVEYEELLVVTGPIFLQREITSEIGENEVSIPDYFYKIIFDIYPPEYKMIAFLLKNEKSNVPLLEYVISVDSLEQISGFDFFPMLPDSLENRLENNEKYEYWFE